MKKIVITGALGHIGSKLLYAFPETFKGSEIVMIDNMYAQRYCSLFNLPENGRYRFFEEDVIQADLDSMLEGASVVLHLAAITNAAGSFEMREKVEYNNYTATKRVAEGCLKNKVPMIHLSSTSVYGTQSDIVDEDCLESDLKPQSPYAESKLREERLLAKLSQENGLEMIVLRFGTIFGVSSGMRFHTAVNKFCWQAVMGQPITVWSTAYNQKRPYLDLNDAYRAISFVIKNELFNGEVYNVLTHNLTVKEVVETIKMHVEKVKIDFVDTKIMNQLSYNVASEKISRQGFIAEGSIENGILETISYLRNANRPI